MECFYLYIFTAPIKQPHNRQGGSCKWYYFNFREGHTGGREEESHGCFHNRLPPGHCRGNGGCYSHEAESCRRNLSGDKSTQTLPVWGEKVGI